MARVYVHSFGCRASQADGAAIEGQLAEAGLQRSSTPEDSDIVVLNTCTVTAAADAEARQTIRRIHRANSSCRILVTGCYAQRAPAEIAALQGVAWVVGNSHKNLVAKILADAQAREESLREVAGHPIATSPTILAGEIPAEFHFSPVFAGDRTRPTLKIQDGCNARCSFCVIPFIRGRSRSLAPDIVIQEVLRLDRQGYKEVVFSGINLGTYGRDLGRSTDILRLLEKILGETSIARVRISSIEPMDVSAELVRLASREMRIARHLHVPLQSGSDRILRRMNRRYWARQYAERILAIREALPDAAMGADVMVGFPGETAEDHEASARFISSLPLTYLHVFPYSARPGTRAAAGSDQVDPHTIRERGRELASIAASKYRAFLETQVGRTLSILTLHAEVDGGRLGLSSNYLKVVLPDPTVPANMLLEVAIDHQREGRLYGRTRRRGAAPADANLRQGECRPAPGVQN